MAGWSRRRLIPIVALGVLLLACASPQAGQRAEGGSNQPGRSAPKRLVTAIMAEPATLHRALFRGGVTQAQDISDYFVNSGMSAVDSQGMRRPILAEALPSVENGLWK